MRQIASGTQAVPLTMLVHRRPQSHFLWALALEQGLNDTRDIQGGTKLSSIRVRVGGTAFSWTEELAEVVIHFLDPSPTAPAGRWHIWVSINLVCLGQYGWVGWVSSCRVKGCQLDSWLGTCLGWGFGSRSGHVQGHPINVSLSCMCFSSSLFPSLTLSLKIN